MIRCNKREVLSTVSSRDESKKIMQNATILHHNDNSLSQQLMHSQNGLTRDGALCASDAGTGKFFSPPGWTLDPVWDFLSFAEIGFFLPSGPSPRGRAFSLSKLRSSPIKQFSFHTLKKSLGSWPLWRKRGRGGGGGRSVSSGDLSRQIHQYASM